MANYMEVFSMSAIAKDPRQNQPGKPTLVSFKQKGKKGRNWTAGVIASAIAVAWAVGGLVMPSLAATPSAQASVKPTVNVSPDANFNIGTNGNVRYRLAYTGQLFSTKDPQEAAAHYGDTAQVGDFTAHYLPKECITKANRLDTMGDMKGTPRWDGYDALEQVAPDRGKIAQKPLGQNAPMGFGAWVIFPGSSSATLPFNPSGSASRAATSDRSAAEPEEEDADTLTLSLEPIEGEATETGATQARIFGKTADPAGDSGTSTEPSGAGNAPQLPANPEEPSSAPELSPESPAPAAVGEDRAANPTPTKTIFSGAVPFGYKFEPTMKEIKLKFDPSVDKDTAIANFNKQVDEAQADVMNQLEQFMNGKPFDARTKKAMVDNLNLQFDNLRKQGLAWFEEQYSKHPSASKFPGIKACEDNGPIVPVGSFILVKNWTAATKGEPNVWQWARKHRNEGQAYHAAIDFLALYPSDTKNSFKVDGQASFCVEPFYGYQIGNHKVYTDPSKSTIYWAKDNPEKAETVKALAWHYAKYSRGANWGHYQNAIWMVIFGITDNGRAWNLDQMSWGDTGVTDVKNLIQEARTAYQHRQDGNVVKALETMHLDQVSLQPANDGGSLLTVQLNDYNPNSTEGRIIGDQVYLAVEGATYADGKPIPNNHISLREALNGVTLKIANQNAFKISFAGSVKNVEDPYFIDNPNGPTQAQVVVLRKDLDLSGSLEVKWTYVPQPKPAISTTAKVNGAESVPGGAETATFSKADEVITLTDDVKYENIPADTASNRKYLIGTLTKVSEGIAKKVFTQVADAKISGQGTVTGLFPYEVKASEVKKGDRFYYEEILVTSDPKYAGG
ncbi:adhesin, partial [Mobiluncus curtisii]|nr:adhesin [Mobiluncus curtisii]